MRRMPNCLPLEMCWREGLRWTVLREVRNATALYWCNCFPRIGKTLCASLRWILPPRKSCLPCPRNEGERDASLTLRSAVSGVGGVAVRCVVSGGAEQLRSRLLAGFQARLEHVLYPTQFKFWARRLRS